MRRFKAGEIHVLVSTTVIEVGIDVPNASVMLIEHAERFGLSQLHQLRGRVGRGPWKSYCILLTSGRLGEDAQRRDATRWSRRTTASASPRSTSSCAGPGEFFGTRQSGLPEFRVADLLRDAALARGGAARGAAPSSRADPELRDAEHRGLRAGAARALARQARARRRWAERAGHRRGAEGPAAGDAARAHARGRPPIRCASRSWTR